MIENYKTLARQMQTVRSMIISIGSTIVLNDYECAVRTLLRFLQQPQALSRRAPHVFASLDVSSGEVSSGDA